MHYLPKGGGHFVLILQERTLWRIDSPGAGRGRALCMKVRSRGGRGGGTLRSEIQSWLANSKPIQNRFRVLIRGLCGSRQSHGAVPLTVTVKGKFRACSLSNKKRTSGRLVRCTLSTWTWWSTGSSPSSSSSRSTSPSTAASGTSLSTCTRRSWRLYSQIMIICTQVDISAGSLQSIAWPIK